jgi:hypothetical protein
MGKKASLLVRSTELRVQRGGEVGAADRALPLASAMVVMSLL